GLAVGQDFDADAVKLLDFVQFAALLVEEVEGRFLAGAQRDLAALAARGLLLDQTQRAETRRRCGANETRALAMRTGPCRGFEYAGAQPLTAHLHQTKAGNAADLDARAVVLQRFLHGALDLADVRTVIHVDEVDHDQPRHVPQAQLPRDLVRGLEVGVERGLLDIMLAR